MEARSMQVYYVSYNSIINDGRRVRRMRRTQLSAEKIRNSSYKKTDGFHNFSKEKSVAKESSLAKIEPRRHRQKNENNRNILQSAQNEYYNDYNDCVDKIDIKQVNAQRDHSRASNKYQDTNAKSKQHSRGSQRKSSKLKSKEQSPNGSIEINSKQNKKNLNEGPYYGQESHRSKGSNINSSRSRKSVEKLSPNLPIGVQQNSQNYKDQSKQINKSISNSVSKTSQKKSYIRNQIKKQNADNKNSHDLDQYGFREQRNSKNANSKMKNNSNPNSKLHQSSKVKVNDNPSHISNSSKLQISKDSSQKKEKQQILNQPSAFKEVDEIFSKEISNIGEQPQNISKIKLDQHANPIINSSSAKKQSWKDAIRSLTELGSQMNEQVSQHQNTKNEYESKKLSLQIDSMRQDNLSATDNKIESSHRNTWRNNLPLSSREPSRKSIDSMGSNAQPGSLQSVIGAVELHDFLIEVIDQFKVEFQNQKQKSEDSELLCFLLEKKFFLEKTNMLKALKGGKNIFRLSNASIQTDILKQYLQTQQILHLVRQLERQTRQIFKNLQKKYLQIKPRLKSNPYFKLETPNDSFSKQIVRILQIEIYALSDKLKGAQNVEVELKCEARILNIMEMVFMFSEMSGRKVKKVQLYDEVEDFEKYYEQNQEHLLQTFQYFKNFK